MSLQDYNYIAQSMVNEDRSASVNTNTKVADAINDGDIVGAKDMVNKRLYEMAADRLKADSILRESMQAMGDEDEERRRLAALNMSMDGEFEDEDDDDDDEMEMEGLYASRMQRRRKAVNAAHKPGHWGEGMHGGMRKRRKMGETRGGRFREQVNLGVDVYKGINPGVHDNVHDTFPNYGKYRGQPKYVPISPIDTGDGMINASAHPGAMRKRRGMGERRGGGPRSARALRAAHQPGHWGEAMHKRHLNAAAGGYGGAGGGNGNRFSMRRATR